MIANNSHSEPDATADEVWPRKLNKLLIVIGVVVFGLIIADRLMNMFAADDIPDVADVPTSVVLPNGANTQTDESVAVQSEGNQGEISAAATQTVVSEDALTIEGVFGSPLVFVSTSEPFYVVTENEVRIDVGSQLGLDTTLAGVTGDRVILERAGDLLSIALPDPEIQ